MQCPMRTRLEVSRSKPGLKVILPTGDGVRDLPTWKTACHCLKKSWHVTNPSIAGAIAEKQFRNTASDMEKWDLKFLDGNCPNGLIRHEKRKKKKKISNAIVNECLKLNRITHTQALVILFPGFSPIQIHFFSFDSPEKSTLGKAPF